ncbi:MAG: BatA and WFA domain-containing protein, partial [Planctomycetales bacterium]|nr:BatA and WFA domain-containing protein [Planctomycetales bacterium]
MLPQLTNLLTWWQWAAILAVPPAILLLYFLKLKRQPVSVPSTYLWHKAIEDLHVNSLWQRLRRSILLFLQLLAVLLVIAALTGPSWEGSSLSGDRFIFIVDNSASMQATDVSPTRLDAAREQVADLIDQLDSGDVAMLISFAESARVEQPFTNNRSLLRERLA